MKKPVPTKTKHDPIAVATTDMTDHKRHQPLYNTNHTNPAPVYEAKEEGVVVEYDDEVRETTLFVAHNLYYRMADKLAAFGYTKEDVIAECEAQAFTVLIKGKWKQGSSLKTFLYSCLLNVCRSLLANGAKQRERIYNNSSPYTRDHRLDAWVDRTVDIHTTLEDQQHGVRTLLAARHDFTREEWQLCRLHVQKKESVNRLLFTRWLDTISKHSKQLGA